MKRETRKAERGRRSLRRLDNRGEMGSGCIFMLLLLLGAGYVGYLFAMPWFEYNNFEARISEMMPYYRNHDAEFIQESIISTASKDFDLKLNDEQVKVQVLTQQNRLIIDINYSKVVQMPFYTHTLTFKPHLTGNVF